MAIRNPKKHRTPVHVILSEGRKPEVEGSWQYVSAIPPGAYFLTDEKVCKESPRNFRMFLGLFRRPKREVDKIVVNPTFPPLPP